MWIEPHLGYLKQATAKMPHPRGEISIALRREGAGIAAEISLPVGVTGSFVWAGKSIELHAGAQALHLP